ncbi:MAG: hypothetical protein ABFS56_34030 [Pseudomonadota bacterium]
MSFEQDWNKRLQQAQSIQITLPVVATPQIMPDKTAALKERIENIRASLILPYSQLTTDPNVLIDQLIDMSNVPPDPDPVLDKEHLQVLKEYSM